jgi:hypothetical protein
MTQNDLNRAVARATGESVSTIAHLGFGLAESDFGYDETYLSEMEDKAVDWDALDEQRVALMPA